MPTPPPHQAQLADPEPHHARHIAESFGSDSERYDRTRPRYPDAMVARIVAASPGRDVLDVGCGTGIAARQFHAAGCTVLGIDVDPRMAEFARRGGLEVEVAKFEDWDGAGRTFATVVAGQTWHWLDPVAGAAKVAQVLQSDGRLAVFWNAAQPPADLAHAFGEVYGRSMPDSLAARGWTRPAVEMYSMLCTRAVDGIGQAGGFSDPEQWRFDWQRDYTREEWLDQLPTQSDHSQFPPAQLDELLAGIGAAIDAVGGRFTMRYATLVVTTTRTAAA